MQEVSAAIREAFHNINIQISLKELCEVAKVSPSQVRYWEKKGYIHSQQAQKNQNHRYDLPTLAKAICIRVLLEHGYTLQAAVKQEEDRHALFQALRKLINDRISEMRFTDQDTIEIDLGPLDDQPQTHVLAVIDSADHTKLCLSSKE